MLDDQQLAHYSQQYDCGFEQAKAQFPELMQEALQYLDEPEIEPYLEGASFLCKIGMGVEPSLAYLHCMPIVAQQVGVESFKTISDYAYFLVRSPNKHAVVPFLQALPAASVRFESIADLQAYLAILTQMIEGTETVIHGHHSMYESAGLIPLLENMPVLLGKLSVQGLAAFIDYGVKNYAQTPEQQVEYFQLKSADAKSVLQREREGTTFKTVERHLEQVKQGLWDCDLPLMMFSTHSNQLRKPMPYLDDELVALPDLYEDAYGLTGLQRYQATLAHLMAHQRWSTALGADNFAPHMQLFIATFEDARVDVLAMRRFVGLRDYFLALHPIPPLYDCDEEKQACLRYRATRLSRALIDPAFDPQDAVIEDFRQQFYAIVNKKGEHSQTQDMQALGIAYYVKTRLPSDSYPDVYFEHTNISYRDDNRCLWFFYEETDEADDETVNEYENDEDDLDESGLPPRYYDEWDYLSDSYRPNWVRVYEHLQPAGNAQDIDQLLAKHQGLVKQLKQLIDRLKPQDKQRIRFQEEGEELDLDIALRSLIELKTGANPDTRINFSHTPNNRHVAVMLLVDLSQSLNEKVNGSEQTLLELSQEALAIVSWTMDQLGDQFAVAGFHSDTRKAVRYYHLKGYSEQWGDEVKARLATMSASYSTRMGAAMRHAAHYLGYQQAEKKLLLVLTDGEPADIDVKDPQFLIQDAKMAVSELQQQGIYSYCINMDQQADNYVETIFDSHFTVIDHVEKLPELLPQVFMRLTH